MFDCTSSYSSDACVTLRNVDDRFKVNKSGHTPTLNDPIPIALFTVQLLSVSVLDFILYYCNQGDFKSFEGEAVGRD